MDQNSTNNIFIKSLYEKISLSELTIITNSTKEQIVEQKEIFQSFLNLQKRTIQPNAATINSILLFSEQY